MFQIEFFLISRIGQLTNFQNFVNSKNYCNSKNRRILELFFHSIFRTTRNFLDSYIGPLLKINFDA